MKKEIIKLLRMAGIFKMSFNRWPKNAAELLEFVECRGWRLEIDTYYQLIFQPVSETLLKIEMAWPAPGNWLSRLGVELELKNRLPENELKWTFKTKTLSPEKKRTRSYCLLEPVPVNRKKSA